MGQVAGDEGYRKKFAIAGVAMVLGRFWVGHFLSLEHIRHLVGPTLRFAHLAPLFLLGKHPEQP